MAEPNRDLFASLSALLDATLIRSTMHSSRSRSGHDIPRIDPRDLAAQIQTLKQDALAAIPANMPEESRLLVLFLIATLEQASSTAFTLKAKRLVFAQYKDVVTRVAPDLGTNAEFVTEQIRELPTGVKTYIGRITGAPPKRFASAPLADRGDEIEERYRDGETAAAIAAECEVSSQAIQQLLKRRGVTSADQREMRDARIQVLARQGKTLSAIAGEMDLSLATVRNALHRLGLTPVRAKPEPRRTPPEKIATVIRLRSEGLSIREIATATGNSESWVSQCLIRNGHRTVTRQPRGSGES